MKMHLSLKNVDAEQRATTAKEERGNHLVQVYRKLVLHFHIQLKI